MSISVTGSAMGVTLMSHLLVLLADRLRFEGSHLRQTAQVARGLAELSTQKRFDEIPRDGRSHRTASHTHDVHMVVFDPLLRREVVMHEPSANAWYLVCADRRADAAATDCNPTLHGPCRHSTSERDDEVGIIVPWVQAIRPEIDNLMSGPTEMSNQFFLQSKPTMIRGNSHAHVILLGCIQRSALPRPRGRPTAEPVCAQLARRELTYHRREDDGAFRSSRSRSQPTVFAGRDLVSDTSTSSGASLGRLRSAPRPRPSRRVPYPQAPVRPCGHQAQAPGGPDRAPSASRRALQGSGHSVQPQPPGRQLLRASHEHAPPTAARA